MELRLRLTRKRVAIFAAALAVAATGSIGLAAVGDDGTIQGCVTQNGTIDAIDPLTQACRDRQTQVEWYTKGGADAAFLGSADKAADADKLDGLDSTAFLGATAKAADSDKLDGLDSTAFMSIRAGGTTSVDPGFLLAGECRQHRIPVNAPINELVIANATMATGLTLSAPSPIVPGFLFTPNGFTVAICNVSASAFDPAAMDIRWVVLRSS
jgi:hypothetical protein